MGGGGGEPKVKYYQSPEQRQVMQALLPMAQRLGQQGVAGEGLYQIPDSPAYPTLPTPGDYAGAIADPMMMLPSAQLYGQIAPQVSAGLWKPYEQAGQRLWDVMQSKGQLGSQRGGVSAGAGAALGELYSQGAQNVGLDIFRMAQAPMQQYWGALTRAQQLPLQQQYAAELGKAGAEFGQSQQAWRAQLQSQMMPWQMMPGLIGGAYPEAVMREQKGGGLGSMLGGAGMGALMGIAMAPATGGFSLAASPWLMPSLGAGAGFLSSGGAGGK